MNILQVCNKVPFPAIDGGAIATLNLSKGFVKNGHKVTVLAMNTLKHRVHKKDIPDHLLEQINFEIVNVDAKISVMGIIINFLFSKLPYTASRFIDVDFNKSLISILHKEEFDIVQLEGLYLTSYIETIRLHSKALIAFRAHNIEHEIWERVAANESNLIKRIYFHSIVKRIKKLELSVVNSYDLLVPITIRDAERFLIFGNRKPCHVSQTGIFASDYKPNPELLKDGTVVHIGALDWAPNQEGLFWFFEEIWEKVLAEEASVQLRIAGRNAPEWLIKKIQSQRNTEYLGEIEDAHSFINSGVLMIIPLKSGSGMRIKVIEGMALAKCMVSTSIGVEGIQLVSGKHMIVADSSSDFARGILLLLRNKDRVRELGQNARKLVEQNFDNGSISGELVDFYQKEIGSRQK